MQRVPERFRSLPRVNGPFEAFQIESEDWQVRVANYPPGMQSSPHSHPTETYGVVTRGELVLAVRGSEQRLGPGDWYELAPDEVHAARFDVESSLIEFTYRGRA